jgi:hypothetical protein
MRDDFFIDREATPDGSEDGGVGEFDAGYEDDAGGEEWTGPSQGEWEATQNLLAYMAAQLSGEGDEEGYEQGYDAEQEGYEQGYDPSYGQAPYPPADGGYYGEPQMHPVEQMMHEIVDNAVNERIQAAMEPFDGVLGSVAEDKGEQIARAELDRIAGQTGEFDRTQAVLIADALVNQGYDAMGALQTAAQMQQQHEAQLKQRHYEEYRQGLGSVAGAGEPGVGGGASTMPEIPEGESPYRAAALRVLAARRPGHTAG